MTEIPTRDTQLDRLEGKVDQVLDRLTRIEERTDSHAGKIKAHDTLLSEHASRIRDAELRHAVHAATGDQDTLSLKGRWVALGAIALAALSTLGTMIARVLFP